MQDSFKNNKLRVAVLFGGPSLERGISINSARSLVDHLGALPVELTTIYYDKNLQPYRIKGHNIYSNTPSDFDFKICDIGDKLTQAKLFEEFSKYDIFFPAIHGEFGEDGRIQEQLESFELPFVGSPSNSCRIAFDKYAASKTLNKAGFFCLPSLLIQKNSDIDENITNFWNAHIENICTATIVKPNKSGSSIGVQVAFSSQEAAEAVHNIFFNSIGSEAIIEPFCTGKEFTVIVIESPTGEPVALIPTEIELKVSQYNIFNYRRKYLPTYDVRHHIPPRFAPEVTEKIRESAEKVFSLFKLRDFARLDGWVLEDGNIWFSDINPISGMEQNSFFFQQAAYVGLSHTDVLSLILKNACTRHGLSTSFMNENSESNRQKINVIFGGDTAERQVSLMSGTNVWLKLRCSEYFEPTPFFLDKDKSVWHLPYRFCLFHTVEEISDECRSTSYHLDVSHIRIRLGLSGQMPTEFQGSPQQFSLEEFIKLRVPVFIALHGGIGENGIFQSMLENEHVAYTGCNSTVSELCMNKHETMLAIERLNVEGIVIPKQIKLETDYLVQKMLLENLPLWNQLADEIGSKTLIVKPIGDGCSAGVAKLNNNDDLKIFMQHVYARDTEIPQNALSTENDIIELPTDGVDFWIFEDFVETDKILADSTDLVWENRTGWVEVTVGIIGTRSEMKALNPSITIAKGEVLTVEEKFQGGTGINITPPPSAYVDVEVIDVVKRRVETLANELGLEGYSRIDLFMRISDGLVRLIEINTLPALTPSTVIFHQALAEEVPMNPKKLLEQIIEFGLNRHQDKSS